MAELTQEQMIKIISEGTISEQSKEIKDQICNFAFGEDFMQQEPKEKGRLKEYEAS